MKITIQYWAQARQAAGTPSETLQLDQPCTIPQLLNRLAEAHGDPLRRVIIGPDGQPHPSILLLLGDHQIRPDSSVPLQDGVTLAIIPPIAGG